MRQYSHASWRKRYWKPHSSTHRRKQVVLVSSLALVISWLILVMQAFYPRRVSELIPDFLGRIKRWFFHWLATATHYTGQMRIQIASTASHRSIIVCVEHPSVSMINTVLYPYPYCLCNAMSCKAFLDLFALYRRLTEVLFLLLIKLVVLTFYRVAKNCYRIAVIFLVLLDLLLLVRV